MRFKNSFQRFILSLAVIVGGQVFWAPSFLAAQEPVASLSWEDQNRDKPFLTLLREYEARLNDDWSYDEEFHYRLKVQKDVAKRLGEQQIYYNKSREEIISVEAFVEAPDGQKFPYTNIQDLAAYEEAPMYSDVRVKVITLPQVSVGSVIDVRVKSKTNHKAIREQYWDVIPYPSSATKLARYSYIFPKDKPIRFKAHKNERQPVIEEIDGAVRYIFEYTDTKQVKNEEYMPPEEEIFGISFFSSMSDWKVVADWYRDLTIKNTVEDPKITETVQKLIEGKTTDKEKTLAVLEFLQDNFRYVSMSFGDHTVEPHPTPDVLNNLYGDCKDWSLLAKQMLAIAGIRSEICLFSSEFDGNPQNGLPNVEAFNHVILKIAVDGQSYYVDPQIKGFGLGQLPSEYDFAHVLVIEDEGYHFDQIPEGKKEERSNISQNQIYVNPDGSADIETRLDLSLDVSQQFRQQWEATTDQNKERFFAMLETNFTKGGTIVNREINGLDNRYGPVQFILKYHSPNAYPVVNDMILIKEDEQNSMPEFADKEREYPIFIPVNVTMTNFNTYHLPEDLNVDFVPEDYSLSIDFMELKADYEQDGKLITVESIMNIKRATVPAERYGEVMTFRKEVFKKADQYIILKRKEI